MEMSKEGSEKIPETKVLSQPSPGSPDAVSIEPGPVYPGGIQLTLIFIFLSISLLLVSMDRTIVTTAL